MTKFLIVPTQKVKDFYSKEENLEMLFRFYPNKRADVVGILVKPDKVDKGNIRFAEALPDEQMFSL